MLDNGWWRCGSESLKVHLSMDTMVGTTFLITLPFLITPIKAALQGKKELTTIVATNLVFRSQTVVGRRSWSDKHETYRQNIPLNPHLAVQF